MWESGDHGGSGVREDDLYASGSELVDCHGDDPSWPPADVVVAAQVWYFLPVVRICQTAVSMVRSPAATARRWPRPMRSACSGRTGGGGLGSGCGQRSHAESAFEVGVAGSAPGGLDLAGRLVGAGRYTGSSILTGQGLGFPLGQRA
jgi:hypothetical protein